MFSKNDVLDKAEFSDPNLKVRITTFIDSDILNVLRSEAKKTGRKYQSILNSTLRNSLISQNNFETKISNIEKRLIKIERKIS